MGVNDWDYDQGTFGASLTASTRGLGGATTPTGRSKSNGGHHRTSSKTAPARLENGEDEEADDTALYKVSKAMGMQ